MGNIKYLTLTIAIVFLFSNKSICKPTVILSIEPVKFSIENKKEAEKQSKFINYFILTKLKKIEYLKINKASDSNSQTNFEELTNNPDAEYFVGIPVVNKFHIEVSSIITPKISMSKGEKLKHYDFDITAIMELTFKVIKKTNGTNISDTCFTIIGKSMVEKVNAIKEFAKSKRLYEQSKRSMNTEFNIPIKDIKDHFFSKLLLSCSVKSAENLTSKFLIEMNKKFNYPLQEDLELKGKRSPAAATMLELIPGAGHLYLGDYKDAGLTALGLGTLAASCPLFLHFGDKIDSKALTIFGWVFIGFGAFLYITDVASMPRKTKAYNKLRGVDSAENSNNKLNYQKTYSLFSFTIEF